MDVSEATLARLPFPESTLTFAAVKFAHRYVAWNVLDDLASGPMPYPQICLGCLAAQLVHTTQGSFQHREAVVEKLA